MISQIPWNHEIKLLQARNIGRPWFLSGASLSSVFIVCRTTKAQGADSVLNKLHHKYFIETPLGLLEKTSDNSSAIPSPCLAAYLVADSSWKSLPFLLTLLPKGKQEEEKE